MNPRTAVVDPTSTMPMTTNNTEADDASDATTVTEASQKGKATEESPDYKSANEDITMVDSHGEEEEEVDKVTDLVDLPADTSFSVDDCRTTPREIFNNSCTKWVDKEGTYMFTAAQAEKARNDLAYEQFGGRPFNGLDWRPTAFKYRASRKTHRRLLRCGFNHACGCEYVVEEIWDNDSGYHWFREGLIPHNDHNQVLKGLMGVPPQIKAALNLPSILRLKPEQFINRIEAKGIFKLDSALRKKMKC